MLTTLNEARAGAPALVARVLASPHPREILLVGAVAMECTLGDYSAHVRQIREIKKGPEVLGVGEISAAVKPGDWAGLQWTDAELQRLRDCKLGDCAFRLPGRSIERLTKEVNWNSAAPLAQARRVLTAELEEITRAYQRGGLAGSVVYRDKPDILDMAAQSRELLASSSGLLQQVPELAGYLDQYPKVPLAGATDSFHWSLEKIGSKPVVSITHNVYYQKACGPGTCLWVASRQIFANHYFDGGLSVTRVASVPSKPGQIWVEYVNRSRTSLVEGAFSGLRRFLIGEGARRAAAAYLERTAKQMRRTMVATQD